MNKLFSVLLLATACASPPPPVAPAPEPAPAPVAEAAPPPVYVAPPPPPPPAPPATAALAPEPVPALHKAPEMVAPPPPPTPDPGLKAIEWVEEHCQLTQPESFLHQPVCDPVCPPKVRIWPCPEYRCPKGTDPNWIDAADKEMCTVARGNRGKARLIEIKTPGLHHN